MAPPPRPEDADPLQSVRIDVWLDVACLFRTRSEAQRAAKGGKVEINGQRAKPHREIRPGDEIRITRPNRMTQVVSVVGLAEHHIPKGDARALYEDRTPPPTEEELAFRMLLRRAGRAPAPDKQQRRQLRRLKGRP
jgi:ribosome-associated heat shock protein Hsp15